MSSEESEVMKRFLVLLAVVSMLAPRAFGDTIGGGQTSVTLDPGFISLLTSNSLVPSVIAPATLSGVVASFPITGGSTNGGNAIIEHSGGLTFTKGATYLSIGNFVIDTANSDVTGFAMNSGGLDVASVPLFTIGSGLTLSLTGTAAGAISATFFNGDSGITQTLTGFKVGIADPQPTVVTPEPESLLLVGTGLLGVASAGYRRFRMLQRA
jgi:hypothetical protein